MSLNEWIKEKDRKTADRMAAEENYFLLSPTRTGLTHVLFPLIEKHIHGLCLDAGAGRGAYHARLAQNAEEVIRMDLHRREGLEACGSVLDLPWRDNTFESIFCSQVLEHVPEPGRALAEFFRCLKPGGVLVLSAPHLAYLHNEPHDYFRFTRHGLAVLLSQAGFTKCEIIPAGGLVSFVGHIPSVVVKAIFADLPLLGPMVMAGNRGYSRLVAWIDRRLDRKKLFALNYGVVAHKPGGGTTTGD